MIGTPNWPRNRLAVGATEGPAAVPAGQHARPAMWLRQHRRYCLQALPWPFAGL